MAQQTCKDFTWYIFVHEQAPFIFKSGLIDFMNTLGINFEVVRKFVTDDERIGIGHSKVTADRGFGGHCFPKDTTAIIKTAPPVIK